MTQTPNLPRPFKLERFFAPYEFKARYLLGSSDCQSMSIRELLALDSAAQDALLDQWLGYTETAGASDLRTEIAQLYTSIKADEVLVFAGAEEAIFVAMQTALTPGDQLIVHSPSYQSLYEIALARGCDVSFWPAQEEDGWALDLDWLRDNLRPNTRLVVVNCPHNPTGYLMPAAQQQELIDLLQAHGIFLFSDEVYRGLEYNSADQVPAACDCYDRAMSLGVMSKTYGLAGLRIGWIATHDHSLIARMAAFKDYTTICNSAPSELLSIVALRQREKIVARNLAIIRRNLDLLDRFFADHAELFQWNRPHAGPIAFPRILFDKEIETFCIDLVERQGVMLVPGTCFFHGDKHFRIGFGRSNLPDALEAFAAYLRARGLS